MCTSHLDLFDGLPSVPNIDQMQKLCPREVDVSTNHIGAQKPFDVSSFGVRVFSLMLYVKRPFFPTCNQLLANERSRHISLFRNKLPPF
jgi:hypothetical protein